MLMYVVMSGSSYYMNDGSWLEKSILNGYIPRLYMSYEWAEHDAKRLYRHAPNYPQKLKVDEWKMTYYQKDK